MIGVRLAMGRVARRTPGMGDGQDPLELFIVTLVLTLTIQLQWAIGVGALLSLFAFVSASGSRDSS